MRCAHVFCQEKTCLKENDGAAVIQAEEVLSKVFFGKADEFPETKKPNRIPDAMLAKTFFYIAVLSAVIGMNSAEPNLFFFFSVQLTMLTVGYALYRREKRVKSASPPPLAPSEKRAPASGVKAKAA